MELDIQAASDSLGESLFGGVEEPTEILDPIEPTEELGTETEEPILEVPTEESEAPPVETQEEEVVSPAGAPKTWRKEALAAWETLPQVIKDEVAKREEDMFKGLESYKEKATIGDNFFKAVSPHLDHLQRAGVNPYEEIGGLLEYGKIMRFGTQGERMALLSSIAQEYSIDLLDLAESAPAVPYIDPAVKALQIELQQLKSGRQQEESQRQTQVRQEAQAQIDAFASDPKHEHFPILEPEMTAFMQSGVCKTLEEAYEKALWANPVTRAKEQQRQAAELQAQSQARVKAAEKAKAANLKTNARPGSATAPKGSMDDTLQAQLAEIRSRS